jgi:nucleotide-binding universal stress UspA family protein
MIRTVLAAVDDSARAVGVFVTACETARAFGARVVLFRGVVLPPDYPPVGEADAEALPRKLCEDARKALLNLAAGAPDVITEVRVALCVDTGRAVLDAADVIDADIIAIGCHGWRGWDRLLGTNTSYVVNHARRTVMVVRDKRDAVQSAGADPGSRRPAA